MRMKPLPGGVRKVDLDRVVISEEVVVHWQAACAEAVARLQLDPNKIGLEYLLVLSGGAALIACSVGMQAGKEILLTCPVGRGQWSEVVGDA